MTYRPASVPPGAASAPAIDVRLEPDAISVAQDPVIGIAASASAGTRAIPRSAFFQTPPESACGGTVMNTPARSVPAGQRDVLTCLVCGMTGPSPDSPCLAGGITASARSELGARAVDG